jgi:CRP-like cAMP-binding protein
LHDIHRAGPCRHKPVQERCLSCILDESDYFRELTLAAKLAMQPGMQYRAYERREVLYRESERNDYLYILLHGEVKVYKAAGDGRQQIHRIVAIPGDLIACEDLYLEAAGSTAEAILDTAVCRLRRDFLKEVGRLEGEITEAILRAMARNLNAYIRHIANLGAKTALERVASYLLYLHDTHVRRGKALGLLEESLTRLETAEMLGITQRTLIRSLRKLEARNVIGLARQGYVIGDLPALAHVADGDA